VAISESRQLILDLLREDMALPAEQRMSHEERRKYLELTILHRKSAVKKSKKEKQRDALKKAQKAIVKKTPGFVVKPPVPLEVLMERWGQKKTEEKTNEPDGLQPDQAND
jgi:hypothetical protein